MKKIIFAILAVFLLASCVNKQQNQVTTTQEFQGYQFEQIVHADYDYMMSQPVEYVFFEAEVEFAKPLNFDQSNRIDKITTVFQSEDSVIIYEHNKGISTKKAYYDRWLEDMTCNPHDAVPFNTVLYTLQENDRLPQTRFCTLRRPLAPPFDSCAYFIFGQAQVIVNSCTGQIIE